MCLPVNDNINSFKLGHLKYLLLVLKNLTVLIFTSKQKFCKDMLGIYTEGIEVLYFGSLELQKLEFLKFLVGMCEAGFKRF